jgi:uncharacterized protein involved in outer membrane biogenesis
MRWKWILGIAAAVIVAFLIVVFIVISSYDFNKLKPQITDLAKKYTGRDLTLEGDISVGIGLSPILKVEKVAFQNAAWGSRPQMAQLKGLEAQVALIPILRGEIVFKQLTILEPDFLIEISKSGQINLDFDTPKKAVPKPSDEKPADDTALLFQFDEVNIQNATITYTDHRQGQTQKILIKKLNLETPVFGNDAEIDLDGSYNNIPLQITGSLGRISTLLNPKEQWPVDLTVKAMNSTASLTGHVTDIAAVKGIDLKIAAKGEDLANFQQITKEPIPLKGPFDIAAHLKAIDPNNAKISEMTIVLGESSLNGELEITQKSSRPKIVATLSSKKLDLRPIVQQQKDTTASQKQPRKSKTRKDKVFSAQPFDLSALQRFDAKISLRVDHIIGLISALDNSILDINLQNGHLIMKPFTGDIGGGKFSGTLDLVTQADNASFKTKITAQKINLGEMLKKMDISGDIEGTLDLDIDLAGQGNSVAALMAGLTGYFTASMGKSKMPVRYLDLVGADLGSSLLKMVDPFEEKVDRAQINCAVCGFSIKDGMANGDAIIIDDPQKTLLSHGTLNLKTEELDFGIQTKPKGGIGTKETGKIGLSLSEITKPFKLGGTLANPSLGISPSRTASIIGRALLAPGGLASLFVTSSHGDQNPCVLALQKSKNQAPGGKTKSGEEAAPEGSGAKEKESLGSKIKNFFSKP